MELGSGGRALALLAAMITPAVLISACGLLVMSTSARLGRVVDRVRSLSEALESLQAGPAEAAALRRREILAQLDLLIMRGRLIQRALTGYYVAVGVFVGTILAIALVAFLPRLGFLLTVLGLLGTSALLYGSVLLIKEARVAVQSIDLEMDYVARLTATTAPAPPAPGPGAPGR